MEEAGTEKVLLNTWEGRLQLIEQYVGAPCMRTYHYIVRLVVEDIPGRNYNIDLETLDLNAAETLFDAIEELADRADLFLS